MANQPQSLMHLLNRTPSPNANGPPPAGGHPNPMAMIQGFGGQGQPPQQGIPPHMRQMTPQQQQQAGMPPQMRAPHPGHMNAPMQQQQQQMPQQQQLQQPPQGGLPPAMRALQGLAANGPMPAMPAMPAHAQPNLQQMEAQMRARTQQAQQKELAKQKRQDLFSAAAGVGAAGEEEEEEEEEEPGYGVAKVHDVLEDAEAAGTQPRLVQIGNCPRAFNDDIGQVLAANDDFMCYALPGGKVRVLSRRTGSSIVVSHNQPSGGNVVDMTLSPFVDADSPGSTLLTLDTSGAAAVTRLSLSDNEVQSERVLLVAPGPDDADAPRARRALWHPTRRCFAVVRGSGCDVWQLDALVDGGVKEVSVPTPQLVHDQDPAENGSAWRGLQSAEHGLTLCAAWSPNGKQLACGYDTGAVVVFDVQRHAVCCSATHHSKVTSLAWSAAGKLGGDVGVLLSAAADDARDADELRLWAVGPGGMALAASLALTRGEQERSVHHVQVDPSGSFAVAAYRSLDAEGEEDDNGLYVLHIRRAAAAGSATLDPSSVRFDYATAFSTGSFHPVQSFCVRSSGTAPGPDIHTAGSLELFCAHTKPLRHLSLAALQCWRPQPQGELEPRKQAVIVPAAEPEPLVRKHQPGLAAAAPVDAAVDEGAAAAGQQAQEEEEASEANEAKMEEERQQQQQQQQQQGEPPRKEGEMSVPPALRTVSGSVAPGLLGPGSLTPQNSLSLPGLLDAPPSGASSSLPQKQASAPAAAAGDQAFHAGSIEHMLAAHLRSVEALISRERVEREREERLRLQHTAQALNGVLNKTIPAAMEMQMEKVMKREMQRTLLPTIGKWMTQSLHKVVGKVLVTSMDRSIKSAVKKSLTEDSESWAPQADDIANSVAQAMKKPVQESFQDCFQRLLLPAFEESTRTMFGQIQQAMAQAVQVQASAANGEDSDAVLAREQARAAETKKSRSQMAALQKQHDKHAQRQQQLLGDVKSSIGTLAKSMTQLAIGLEEVRDTTQALEQRVALQDDDDDDDASAGAFDMPTLTIDPRDEIEKLLQTQMFNAAFTHALAAGDLGVVTWTCSQLDPRVLLSTTVADHKLAAPVMLSLIQQLGFDLAGGADLMLKLTWIRETVMAIDARDPLIAAHVPAIYSEVHGNIDGRLSGLAPDDPCADPARMVKHLLRAGM